MFYVLFLNQHALSGQNIMTNHYVVLMSCNANTLKIGLLNHSSAAANNVYQSPCTYIVNKRFNTIISLFTRHVLAYMQFFKDSRHSSTIKANKSSNS